MGCTASKLDDEDTVRRCKERRRLVKEAVHARQLLAVALADYCHSLRVTGSALSSFAAGEPFSLSYQTPDGPLHPPNSHPSHVDSVPLRVPPSPSPSLHPQPPLPPAATSDQVEMLEIGPSSVATGEPRPVSDQSSEVLLHSPNSHPSHVHPVPSSVPPSSSPSFHAPAPAPPPDLAATPSNKDLKEIVEAIKENFDKAAAAGDQVSKMLELDRSYRQLKSSSKSLCSTLDVLLAWEKKLYEEVKAARDGAKIEHDKKLSALQSQENKAGNETKLDKIKASVKRLHSLIIVNSQAVSTTSTSIIGLRDSDLVPQLAGLFHGFMYMWRSMHQYHEVQNHIVQRVSDLVNRSGKGDSTSKLHRLATRDLESAVSAWHSSFSRLIKFQGEFIRSLHGWFKLTLIPVSNDNVDDNREPSTVFAFCDGWKLALDRVPDTIASEAIKSFINAVHEISVKQTEELKIKKRTETVSKEFEKKASALWSIKRKFYHPYSMVGISVPDTGPDDGQVLDAPDPLADKKSELAACRRRLKGEMQRLSKAVEATRAVTLNNLRAGFSEVFQALINFSVSYTGHLSDFAPIPRL